MNSKEKYSKSKTVAAFYGEYMWKMRKMEMESISLTSFFS